MRRLFLFLAFAAFPLAAQADSLPRVLLALYDSRDESTPRFTQVHRLLEMPANHLGFDIHYHNINAPLPELGPDVRGVVIWLNRGTKVSDTETYISWLESVIKAGKKLIIIESDGIDPAYRTSPKGLKRVNRLMKQLGLRDNDSWHTLTYQAKIISSDPQMVGFERELIAPLPPITDMAAVPPGRSHLKIAPGGLVESNSDLVVTSPNGGYIAEGYAVLQDTHSGNGNGNGKESWLYQWYVNPFHFLDLALDAGDYPRPDATTLFGRRIFYSHIDGDGWNNVSEINGYRTKNVIAADVLRQEIIEQYPDFAFSVGIITSDLDTACHGVAASEEAARTMLRLANVEPSSHTHSHPLFWRFFQNYTAEKEAPLLNKYPPRPALKSSPAATLLGDAQQREAWRDHPHSHGTHPPVQLGRNEESEEEILSKYYHTPRSYACTPFDLSQEIEGSIRTINALAPEGKKVRLLQWPGDTAPFEQALAHTREAGILNMNGGDSRFDNEYPSYAWVAPFGLKLGAERQIYSSNSNENTYTNLWTDRFFGFRYLISTVHNTESPVRVKPFNVYFHVYSAQKMASLNAVRENLDFARSQEVIPITASHYADIVGGFYSTRITPLGNGQWQVRGHSALSTVRFDRMSRKAVDFAASRGVIGQRYFQGSLYVALDPDAKEALIALKPQKNIGIYPQEAIPYLVESRWSIKNLKNSKNSLVFSAQGYGTGEMTWMMPQPGTYTLRCLRQGQSLYEGSASSDGTGLLRVALGCSGVEPVEIQVSAAARKEG